MAPPRPRPRQPANTASPASPRLHHLPMPRMRTALPRPAALRRLRHLLPPHRTRRQLPALRRTRRPQRLDHGHMNTQGVNFRPPPGGQNSSAVDKMIRILMAGTGSGGDRNFAQTVRNPVDLERYAHALTASQYRELKQMHGQSARVWGFEAKRGTAVKAADELKPGDLAWF